MSDDSLVRDAPEQFDEIHTPALQLLSTRRRLFVLHYICGEEDVRGVAYKSYTAAGFTAANNNVASVCAHELLKNELVQEAMEEVRAEMDSVFKRRMESWAGIALDVQRVMKRAVDTILHPDVNEKAGTAVHLSSEDIALCNTVLDRAYGRPKQIQEHEIGDKLDSMIKRLAGKKTLPLLPPAATHRVAEIAPPED